MTLGLLHGCKPDVLVLCHRAGSTAIDDYPGTPIPPLPELIKIYEAAVGWVRPAQVRAIALNTRDIADDAAARAEIDKVAAETGLPVTDPVRFGGEGLLDAVLMSAPVAADVHIALRDGSTAHVRPVVPVRRARAA